MTQRLLALIAGLALAAAPATAVAAPSRLHDCGTKVDRSSAVGWCQGTGAFRVVVTCADGTTVTSGLARITGGYGALYASCRNSAVAATGAKIVEVVPETVPEAV